MEYDFVVVGGGAHGCATAYHLASAGASVVLLEAGKIAVGASGGFGKRGVRANRRDLRELPLMREGYALWPELGTELGAETGYERTGGIYLIEQETTGSAGGLVSAPSQVHAQQTMGIPTEYWEQDRIREAFPSVSSAVKGGIFAPLDGVASQEATTLAYAHAAQRNGAEILEESRVAAVSPASSGSAGRATTTDGRTFVAKRRVLLASNTGTLDLAARNLDYRIPAWPILPQAILLRSEHTPAIPHLTAHDSRPISVKILDDNIVMLSGGWRGRWNKNTSRGETVPANVQGNIDQLRTVFPGLGELTVLDAEASRAETASIDQIPFIDEVPGTGIIAATGWTGHGWALVPSVARNLAQWLLTGHRPPILDPFSFSRLTGK